MPSFPIVKWHWKLESAKRCFHSNSLFNILQPLFGSAKSAIHIELFYMPFLSLNCRTAGGSFSELYSICLFVSLRYSISFCSFLLLFCWFVSVRLPFVPSKRAKRHEIAMTQRDEWQEKGLPNRTYRVKPTWQEKRFLHVISRSRHCSSCSFRIFNCRSMCVPMCGWLVVVFCFADTFVRSEVKWKMFAQKPNKNVFHFRLTCRAGIASVWKLCFIFLVLFRYSAFNPPRPPRRKMVCTLRMYSHKIGNL